MDRHNNAGGMSQLQGTVLRTNVTTAKKLPEPGETWLGTDIGLDAGEIKKFQQVGLIKKREYASKTTNRYYWETAEGVHEWLERREGNQSITPCENATGIRTITPGEEYTCTCDDCDCRMDRETAAEVIA